MVRSIAGRDVRWANLSSPEKLSVSFPRKAAQMDPLTLALAGLLAYRTYQGQGKLAEWIGHKGPNADAASAVGGAPSQQLPPLLQSLGAAPLAQGLSDLLSDFQQKGFGETIKSWVETGPNKPVSARQLEQALGEERIAWLLKQTGISRQALLEGLSRELPPTIDQLTPEGRLPTEQEVTRRFEAPKPAA
jgi:uncharacterized protein YidB (DUF937 family)